MTLPADLPCDVHVHIQPREMMRPGALETIRRNRDDHELVERVLDDPQALIDHMDAEGIGRIGIINYVAADIMGFTEEVNAWSARYRDAAPDRLIAYGGLHPPACSDVPEAMRRLLGELRLDAFKLHPPHQDLDPSAYRRGRCPGLAQVYESLQEAGIPLMVHTGTSVFPGARSRLGDPMLLDDVAVDFPELTIIMAHGGRPLWTEAAFFLLRRHRRSWLDLSGIPPARIPEWFPRLEEVGDRVVFGTDWPSPGVRSIAANMSAFRDLPFSDSFKQAVLVENARRLFPPRPA